MVASDDATLTFGGFLRATVAALVADLRSRSAPLSTFVAACIVLVFAVQAATALRLGITVRELTLTVFFETETAAWLLSFFLHQSLGHAGANVVVIAVLGRVVEPRFRPTAYLAFVAIAAVLTSTAGYALQAAFTTDPVVSYGASGLAYALAGYAVVRPASVLGRPVGDGGGDHRLDRVAAGTTPGERLAGIVGGVAVLTVAADVLTGPYLALDWVNGAHLAGVCLGLAVAVEHHRRRRRSTPEQ